MTRRRVANFQPDNLVHQFSKFRVGFVFEGNGNQAIHTCGAGQARQFERQRAVAGDDSQTLDGCLTFDG